MPQPPRIHTNKSSRRVHYIAEWAEKRGMRQSDIARDLEVERSTVKRWFDGAVPTKQDHLERLSELLGTDDISALFRHPDDDWIARFLRDRSEDELDRIIQTLKAAFPRDDPKTANGGK
ncbi:XRE family transcriptional regulator [Breoghania sp. L-A4]|nr:XRE family transcriptional regulator [Breoghania sp. L-A4]